ncbi:hypothetical protein GWI33_006411 [Rhynchophorus ferrugineus]|uniref:Uncharacterized protein n=1 Tax=Rhynchophorus ferrugineus TaxID=354439 RepID=A0A834MIZ9_RHYFE|nr:hypothetical protein GWI33_006411 [Rhynchophorus ferrugineus]
MVHLTAKYAFRIIKANTGDGEVRQHAGGKLDWGCLKFLRYLNPSVSTLERRTRCRSSDEKLSNFEGLCPRTGNVEVKIETPPGEVEWSGKNTGGRGDTPSTGS